MNEERSRRLLFTTMAGMLAASPLALLPSGTAEASTTQGHNPFLGVWYEPNIGPQNLLSFPGIITFSKEPNAVIAFSAQNVNDPRFTRDGFRPDTQGLGAWELVGDSLAFSIYVFTYNLQTGNSEYVQYIKCVAHLTGHGDSWDATFQEYLLNTTDRSPAPFKSPYHEGRFTGQRVTI